MIDREQLLLYLITDDPASYPMPWLESIEAAIAGGVTAVQLRIPRLTGRELYLHGLELATLLRSRKIPLIINNDVALAVALRAEGVHLGQTDLPSDVARQIVGPSISIGLSITSTADLATIVPGAVDHLGIGPVFDARKTKPDAAEPLGLAGLARLRVAVPQLPAVAIGGITVENGTSLIAAGADGLAIVSALSQTADPESAARNFRLRIDESSHVTNLNQKLTTSLDGGKKRE